MKRKNLDEMVEAFVQDTDDDIDAQVRPLSLVEYGEWLVAFKGAINSRIDARIEAWREDMK